MVFGEPVGGPVHDSGNMSRLLGTKSEIRPSGRSTLRNSLKAQGVLRT
jgi:hypothetical protein